MAVILIKLLIRIVAFTAVFWIAAKKNEKVVVKSKWVTPLVALIFAVLNGALYWALKPILNLATFGSVAFIMPLVVNLILLAVTVRIVENKKWLEIKGVLAMLWMSVVLTGAHCILWFALDFVPRHV